MTEEHRIHHIALTMLPHIGDVHIGVLLNHIPDPVAVFKAGRRELESIPGIGVVRANAIRQFTNFDAAEKEYRFTEKNKIRILVKGEEEYPVRLMECVDAPHVLFFKGNTSLNRQRILSVIGTRSPSHYGMERVSELMQSLVRSDVLVVSGLAYGIDTHAHKACIKSGIDTVGVLGHGLDSLYPFSNKVLAEQMIGQGGLLTEFRSGTRPERQHFPQRNRIVAGMSDAVIVIESGEKGGSLITAGLANSYNKEVLAYPGRAIDAMSMGCNRLIRQNRAALVCSGEQVMEYMNWSTPASAIQQQLFTDYSEQEKKVMEILQSEGILHIDQLIRHCQFSSPQLSAVLLALEMAGHIESLPGRRYGALAGGG